MGNNSKFDDPIGYLYCRYCEELKALNSDNFYKNKITSHGFMIYCKVCDDKKRTDRWLNQTSHKVKLNCKQCEGEFWAEKNRVKQGRGKYCSRSCASKSRGMTAQAYNKGENNPKSKLNEEQVREIRKMAKAGISNGIIQERFKITKTHLINIKNGRIWKHVV